jgi:hypothetical protein
VRFRALDLSPRGRGERNGQSSVFSRRVCARALFVSCLPDKQGREAERRQAHPTMSAPHLQTLPPESARARKRADRRQVYAVCANHLRRPARLSALHRGSWLGDRTPPLSLRPRFPDHRMQTGFHPLRASAASSSQTGHRAGRAVSQGRPGAVCETARGHRTRSTFRDRLENAPFMSEIRQFVTEMETNVNKNATRAGYLAARPSSQRKNHATFGRGPSHLSMAAYTPLRPCLAYPLLVRVRHFHARF